MYQYREQYEHVAAVQEFLLSNDKGCCVNTNKYGDAVKTRVRICVCTPNGLSFCHNTLMHFALVNSPAIYPQRTRILLNDMMHPSRRMKDVAFP